MATEDPGDVIYLSSSDEAEAEAQAAATKKRSLEDASGAKEASSAPEAKRLRKNGPVTRSSASKNLSDEDQKSSNGSLNTGDTSTGDSVPGGSDNIPDFKHLEWSFKLPDTSDNKSGSWLKRFQVWVKAFVKTNSAISQGIDVHVAEAAYAWYIDHLKGIKPKKKKSAKQIAKEFESTGELDALLKNILPKGPGPNQPTLDTCVKKQPSKEPVHEGKHSRGSSVSEGEIDEDESESEAEYEPTLSTTERKEADAKEANGDSASKVSNHQSLPIIETHRRVPTGNDALEQQRRYFPSASDPAQMCLLCGLNTHLAPSCPTLVCSCGSLDHSIVCCPEKERCRKCRQVGHQASGCTEKLALTKEEGLACVFCNSTDHLEEQCTEVWRSFHPDVSVVRKVAFIPASCSMCGSDGHFSSDCKPQRNNMSNPTWSVKNRDQYVDPGCGMATIEEATGGKPAGRSAVAPELRIRGHAARTTNVHYSESDDSEVEFLGNKRVQKPAVGQIRMASNIQMPNTQNGRPRRNPRQNGPAQPPLPPGPPPPGPPSMRGLGSFSSLPRKPPPRDFRNVPPPSPPRGPQGQGRPYGNNAPPSFKPRGGGRGGRGGRGGGRGRGRGRGK
ncbi:hypothetical protein SNK03_003518 [Fusarium graminearum]